MAADSGVCPTCGQVIQPPPAYGSRTSTTRKVALGVSVLLHVLLAAYVLLRSDKIEKIPPPKKESAMVYIAPLKDKPQPKPQPKPVAAAVQPDGTPAPATARPADSPATGKLASAQTITVTTDLVKAQINTAGGDIRSLELLTQGAIDNPDKPFMLMTEQGGRTYVAQSGLLSSDASLPTHKTLYAADKTAYTLSPDQNTLTVTLAAAPVNGVEVKKIFTFKRDSYVIDVRYDCHITDITANCHQLPLLIA